MLNASEISWMQTTVSSALDVTVTVQRQTPAQDGYGHDNGPYNTVGTAQVNVIKPSASDLQTFAGIIGSKRALMIRLMATTDIREGDQLVYLGKSWMVHGLDSAESYTFTDEFLITTIS